MKKVLLLLTLICAFSASVSAQQEMSVFSATGRAGVTVTMSRDYQSLGINPANLGLIKHDLSNLERKKKFALGFGEAAVSVGSGALARPDLRANFFAAAGFTENSLSQQEKIQAALDFVDNGVNMNADLLSVGFAVMPSRKVGGFAVGIRDRFASSFRLNSDGANVFFLGHNYADYFDSLAINGTDTVGWSSAPKTFSQLFDGTNFKLNWFREYHLAYGRELIGSHKFHILAGAGVKLIKGLGYVDVNIANGGFNAVSALSPLFGVDYGGMNSPSQLADSGGMVPVGTGFGFDIGLTATFGANEAIKFGISLTDIGSITWSGNVYSAKDTLFNGLGSAGLDNYNVITEVENITGDGSFFNWQGEQEVKAALPTRLRAGGSYRIHEKIEAGFDLVIPFNDAVGNFDKMLVAVGADFRPLDWVRLSTGITATGDYGFNIPCGVYFSPPNNLFEIGIASRDAITFFTRNSPTLSVAFGMLRFRF